VFRFAGTPSEVGRAHGDALADRIEFNLARYRGMFSARGLRWQQVLALAEPIASMLAAYDPALMEEIEGIARGSGHDVMEITAISGRTQLLASQRGREDIPPEENCTAAACLPGRSADRPVLMAQNWDTDPRCRRTTVVMQISIEDQMPILLLTEAGALMMSGMNVAGLGITGNSLYADSDYSRGPGIPVSAVRRRALRHTDLADAAEEFNAAPCAHANNHLLAAAGTPGAVDLEVAPNGVLRVTPDVGVLVHTNHFIAADASSMLTDVGRSSSSDKRHSVMTRTLTAIDDITVADLQAALGDHENYPESICRHEIVIAGGSPAATVSSIVMDLTEPSMWVAVGPSCAHDFVQYRFEAGTAT
jgi:isopenicillin-N N-acyltransferase-like protein